MDKDSAQARKLQLWRKSSCGTVILAVDGICKRRGIGSDPGLILKGMLLLFTQLINASFTRRRSPAVEQAAVQGRETGFQMGEGFSFIHSSLSSDSYQTFTVDQATDIPLTGEGVEAEDVKQSRAHRREKRQ